MEDETTQPLLRCETCRNALEEDDVFCPFCGREAPERKRVEAPAPDQARVHDFRCRSCGASVTYDISVKALRCPYCDNRFLDEAPPTTARARPRWVVPFGVGGDGARSAFRKWLGVGFWRPSNLSKQAKLRQLDGLYLPYWLFDAKVHAYWTADSSATRPGSRADWNPRAGELRKQYKNVPVPASKGLVRKELNAISPYSLDNAVAFDPDRPLERPSESFSVSRRKAREEVRGLIDEFVTSDCGALVPGRHRNLHTCSLVSDTTATPVLLPAWIFAYRYRDKPYRFVLNGQTAAGTGTAPISLLKVLIAAAIGLAALGVVIGLALA